MRLVRSALFVALAVSPAVSRAVAQAPAVPVKATAPTLAPLTEGDKADLAILQLRGELLEAQTKLAGLQLSAAAAARIARIEREHPGYRWHQAAGPNDTTGLVPVPSALPQAK